MKRDLNNLQTCLENIIEAIDNIQYYTEGMTHDDFASDDNRMVRDAVVYNMSIIGETAHMVQKHHPEFAAAHAALHLEAAYRMRNIIFHSYAMVNAKYVWNTVVDDLPTMRESLAAALKTFENQ